MRRFKDNSGLLSKKRFKAMREEHIRRLRSLTVQKSARILQSLTSISALKGLGNDFVPDNPLCLRLGLRRKSK